MMRSVHEIGDAVRFDEPVTINELKAAIMVLSRANHVLDKAVGGLTTALEKGQSDTVEKLIEVRLARRTQLEMYYRAVDKVLDPDSVPGSPTWKAWDRKDQIPNGIPDHVLATMAMDRLMDGKPKESRFVGRSESYREHHDRQLAEINSIKPLHQPNPKPEQPAVSVTGRKQDWSPMTMSREEAIRRGHIAGELTAPAATANECASISRLNRDSRNDMMKAVEELRELQRQQLRRTPLDINLYGSELLPSYLRLLDPVITMPMSVPFGLMKSREPANSQAASAIKEAKAGADKLSELFEEMAIHNSQLPKAES